MKVSYQWIQEYLDFELPPVDELVKKIGNQLGAVEEVIDLTPKYQGIVVAKVVSCQQHPNADKLSVCRIDDGKVIKDADRGDDGLIQVVCGAPNVAEGQLVAWLPPRSTVPNSVGNDPFVLEARELRGEISNGMLASPKELALGDNHEGILVIDEDLKPGADFAEAFKLNDQIIDIENKMFTHRPDCFGQLGVAREIAGIFGKPFSSPEWLLTTPKVSASTDTLSLNIQNDIPDLVPRFSATLIDGLEIKQSPLWLQIALVKAGVKAINNVVDLTNYYMLATGQPLHAYDYDKVNKLSNGDTPTIVVRKARPGEKLKLLNGKEIEPSQDAIMIATDKQLIGVGGVMGGSDTEVDENTKRIIIECANFDMYSIRRASMHHGLFTDASTRFTKGQSPLQTLAVLTEITNSVITNIGGQVAGLQVDDNHVSKNALQSGSLFALVQLSADFINSRLGVNLDPDEIATLLQNVEFKVEQKGDELIVQAPFWRTDIEIPEDLVEEIGRLYGFDKLPLELPQLDLSPAEKDHKLETKAMIRDRLSRGGANEVLTYSFVHGNLLQKAKQNSDNAFQIGNALSPDLQYYRLSLTPSLLDKVHPNNKSGYGEFALFETGIVQSPDFLDDEGLPKQWGRVALVIAADNKAAKSVAGAPYYHAKTYLEYLLEDDQDLTYVPVGDVDTKGHKLFEALLAPYDQKRAAVVYRGEQLLGVVGEYAASVRRDFKLPNHCAGLELFLSAFNIKEAVDYQPLSKFPSVKQDITLKVPTKLNYAELYSFVSGQLSQRQPVKVSSTLEPLGIYEPENQSEFKNVSFRLQISSFERTLTDSEVNKVLDEVAAAAQSELGAERV